MRSNGRGRWQTVPDRILLRFEQSAIFSPPCLGDGTTIVIIVSPAGTATPARQFWRVSVSDTDTDSDTLNNWEEAQLGTDPDVANVTPTITTQPQSTTVTVGQTATFSVTAIGTGTLSYQWWRNGEAPRWSHIRRVTPRHQPRSVATECPTEWSCSNGTTSSLMPSSPCMRRPPCR
ncbi:MAG: hypothetical protein IPL39_05360 [Opitutaceae bacterium]|nr:hypothetical protein [Opitutaceae bacterium]